MVLTGLLLGISREASGNAGPSKVRPNQIPCLLVCRMLKVEKLF